LAFFFVIYKNKYMKENYFVSQKKPELNPKKETINFLLNYSKSLNILKLNSHNFEFIMN